MTRLRSYRPVFVTAGRHRPGLGDRVRVLRAAGLSGRRTLSVAFGEACFDPALGRAWNKLFGRTCGLATPRGHSLRWMWRPEHASSPGPPRVELALIRERHRRQSIVAPIRRVRRGESATLDFPGAAWGIPCGLYVGGTEPAPHDLTVFYRWIR